MSTQSRETFRACRAPVPLYVSGYQVLGGYQTGDPVISVLGACVLPSGHDGVRSDGQGRTWTRSAPDDRHRSQP